MSAVLDKKKPTKKRRSAVVTRDNDSAQTNKSAKKRAIDKHVKAVATFENSRVAQIEKSERRAWRVALGACIICFLSWIGIVLLIPLKTVETHVIRVNETTGAADIIVANDKPFISNSEAIDNYWVNKFVIAYESYDWWTIRKDYALVGALSTRTVGATYGALFQGTNGKDIRYRDAVTETVEIDSVVPQGEGIKTVRFTKITKNVKRQETPTEKSFVATIGYYYSNDLEMTAAQKLVNPLGFFVRSYRVDEEL